VPERNQPDPLLIPRILRDLRGFPDEDEDEVDNAVEDGEDRAGE
jgi:hypothetical protein